MEPGREFEGRRALVTGAAAGIGRSIAYRLARAGAQVACLDVNEKALAETVSGVAAERGRALPLVADVSSETATKRAVELNSAQPSLNQIGNATG